MDNLLTKEELKQFEELYEKITKRAYLVQNALMKIDHKKYNGVCIEEITSIDSDSITVGGWDGCRGCYSFESQSFPKKYFHDDNFLEEELRKKEIADEIARQEAEQRKRQREIDRENFERQEYKRLKEKYEG